MEKKGITVFLIISLFFVPLAWWTQYMNFDTASAIAFLVIILFLVIVYRSKLDFQKMIGIGNLPLIYAVLWRTKFGLKFMDNVATKFREWVKLIGYCFIGFGFVGMIFISINILYMLFQLFVSPKQASEGVSLVLPLTHIPGVGYLSFWYFLITIFITVLIHEFAHGIVARAHNVPVNSSGLGVFSLILPLFPLAFVEPDEKKLSKSSDIVQYSIFAAGPMINIVFALLIVLFSNYVLTPVEENITHSVGFSFSGVMENYSAKDVGMQPGIIINKVDDVEILDYQSFSKKIGNIKPGETLKLTDTNGTTFTILTKPSPDDANKGYIGIQGIQNERRINSEYVSAGPTFFWLKGLFKWMYFINLAIGLMNLLPLMVTDGGRMLKTALEKVYGQGAKANKVWTFIGIVFIFTLLFALVVKYGLQLFSFFSLG